MRGLANLLNSIVEADNQGDYTARNKLILMALLYSNELGLSYGFRIDPFEPEWPVAFIELPEVGQVSWHLPQFPYEWDGHSTVGKNERIERFDVFARSLV